MQKKEIIVIGASSGGIEALKGLVAELPRDLKASVFIAMHVAPYSPGILPEILERAGPLPASNARDWERIEPGHIYVAPPDHHLLVERERVVRVTRGSRENRFRPAVDPLFRSAARAFGPRVVGVILTGWLDDGTAGLHAVKERGGTTVVQHPDDAFAPAMPLNAIKHVEVDHIVRLREIAPLLVRLAQAPAAEEGAYPVSEKLDTEVRIARENNAVESGITRWGDPFHLRLPGVPRRALADEGGQQPPLPLPHGPRLLGGLAAGGVHREDGGLAVERHPRARRGVLLMRSLAEHFSAHSHGTDAEALLKKAQESQQRADLVRRAVVSHEKLNKSRPEAAGEEA